MKAAAIQDATQLALAHAMEAVEAYVVTVVQAAVIADVILDVTHHATVDVKVIAVDNAPLAIDVLTAAVAMVLVA